MEKMKLSIFIACLIALTPGNTLAGDYDWEDIWAPYTQRTDKMTATSGNAGNVNATTHINDPWPVYVQDQHIPGNAARLVGAIERYRHPLIAGGLQQPPVPAPANPSPGNGPQNGGADASGQGGEAGSQ